ncbi:shikimate kinase [Streptomyces griseoloalbus]|uniref:Shikimate kinase n=1 Tax=Streptomyces griseoloalbus TaxID=67303 RepID=A0A7W8BU56_9ACTN|nr:shikimate kinase [Streptomyces albaduncus]MBB5128813.1 shikimate kinase [Streptomyces albaduncus]GGV78545.1 shikimate kinase [Streptomyces griseoloalbus]GGW43660.1 shikimate kinase [Streptomyces albaduncus]
MTAPLIVLVGPMGVGKSTVGALLAQRLRCAFWDTDDVIVAAEGRSVADIFTEEGEERFRALEKDAVATALAEHDGVLALGGGAVLDAGTRRLLAAHPAVVHLSMGVEEAVGRAGLATARPLLAGDPRERWQELAEARTPLYAEVARVVVATDGRTPEEVADAVLDAAELKKDV